MSEEANVGAVIGQSQLGSAIISQALLDEAIGDEFDPKDPNEIKYGDANLAPMMFQDDLMRMLESTTSARDSATKVNQAIKKKGFELNETKCAHRKYGGHQSDTPMAT